MCGGTCTYYIHYIYTVYTKQATFTQTYGCGNTVCVRLSNKLIIIYNWKQRIQLTMWYPSPPPEAIPAFCGEETDAPAGAELGVEHPIWRSGKLRYLTSNITAKGLPEEKRRACRRSRVHGVEVRDLPPNHFLHGEQGLFATVKFSKCDIVGEYTGRIVDSNVNGEYCKNNKCIHY